MIDPKTVKKKVKNYKLSTQIILCTHLDIYSNALNNIIKD